LTEDIYDITIIGAGPVGLYALYYAGLRGLKAKILEALDETGGGLKVLYPEKYIYDVAGYPKIIAKELVKQFDEQARTYDAPIVLGQRVVNIRRREDSIIELETVSAVHYSRKVVICAGLGAFIPRKLDLPSVERLEGAGVYYYIKDISLFGDKNILIVGGGDSAVDNALMLLPVAKKITMIHRNDRFRAHEDSLKQLAASPVELHHPFWEVKELYGDDWVRGVTVVNTFDGKEMTFEIDALILNLGFLTNLKPLKQWGLELTMNAIKVGELMQTNIPGVFAAGDIIHHPGKLKLISTGTGEAAIAVNNAAHLLDPHREVEPGHSSHSKRPDGK
jgi:ferredoxin/flavodoxin---NADP+ reductase